MGLRVYSEVERESQLEKAIERTKHLGKKKIALINPPASFLTDDRVFPPLGLLSVAAVAMWGGHEVTLIDLAGRKRLWHGYR
jgi:hypothetical protein